MSVVELQELEEIKGLLLKGQQVGVLTYAEIATAVSELDLDEADVEELHRLPREVGDRARRGDRPGASAPRRRSARPTSAAAARRRRRSTSGRT